MPKPTIASINGYALGGGCELALACDLRLASSNAKIGQPEIDLGILPGWGGSVRLARTTTLGFAKEMIFSGRPVDAQKALEHGLVNAVYEPGELREKTLDLCRSLEAKSPLALAYAKEAVNLSLQGPHRMNLEAEARLFAMLFASEDQSEGMAAFAEKRPPEFTAAARSSPRRCRRPPGGPPRSRARTSGGAARRNRASTTPGSPGPASAPGCGRRRSPRPRRGRR